MAAKDIKILNRDAGQDVAKLTAPGWAT